MRSRLCCHWLVLLPSALLLVNILPSVLSLVNVVCYRRLLEVCQGHGVLYSGDDYFISESGEYRWERTKLEEAHSWNQQRGENSYLHHQNPIPHLPTLGSPHSLTRAGWSYLFFPFSVEMEAMIKSNFL